MMILFLRLSGFLILGAVAFLILWFAAVVHTARAHGHNGVDYSKWLMPDTRTMDGKRQGSCCNSIDCAPRPSRYKDGGWEVFWADGNKWIKVPEQKVETNYDDAWEPKDNLGHACISPRGNVYCFRPGEFLQ
jgi:hypothetical protein